MPYHPPDVVLFHLAVRSTPGIALPIEEVGKSLSDDECCPSPSLTR
jgi:hypothetical protein